MNKKEIAFIILAVFICIQLVKNGVLYVGLFSLEGLNAGIRYLSLGALCVSSTLSLLGLSKLEKVKKVDFFMKSVNNSMRISMGAVYVWAATMILPTILAAIKNSVINGEIISSLFTRGILTVFIILASRALHKFVKKYLHDKFFVA